jgi:RNA polymerase sigma factor (TIGR02999 family)
MNSSNVAPLCLTNHFWDASLGGLQGVQSSTFARGMGSVMAVAYRSPFFTARGPMSDVTRILSQIEAGDPQAAEKLLPLVYDELRKLAAAKLAQEKPGQTLQATALVHDAYIRLVDVAKAQHWDSRGHFFSAAAEAMRRILVDHALSKATQRRGGSLERLDIDAIDVAVHSTPEQLLAVDEALEKLGRVDSSAAGIVKLRYFAGLTIEQAAKTLGISTATAYRHWNYARVWLHSELLETAGSK